MSGIFKFQTYAEMCITDMHDAIDKGWDSPNVLFFEQIVRTKWIHF